MALGSAAFALFTAMIMTNYFGKQVLLGMSEDRIEPQLSFHNGILLTRIYLLCRSAGFHHFADDARSQAAPNYYELPAWQLWAAFNGQLWSQCRWLRDKNVHDIRSDTGEDANQDMLLLKQRSSFLILCRYVRCRIPSTSVGQVSSF